jgi:hypothetical protein
MAGMIVTKDTRGSNEPPMLLDEGVCPRAVLFSGALSPRRAWLQAGHQEIMSHIRPAVDLDLDEQQANQICSVLNLCFGWCGADSEWSHDAGYTGRVVLNPQAAQEVVNLHDRVQELEAHIVELARACGPLPTAVAAHNGNGNGNGNVTAVPSP